MASPPAPSPIYAADPAPSRAPNPHALAPLPPPPKRLLARLLPSSSAMTAASPPNSLPFPRRPSLPSLRRGPRKLSSASAASSASTKSRASLSKREISLPSPRPDDDEDIFGSAPRRAPIPPGDGGESDDSGFGDHGDRLGEDTEDKATPAPVDVRALCYFFSFLHEKPLPPVPIEDPDAQEAPPPPARDRHLGKPPLLPCIALADLVQATPAPCPSCPYRPPPNPAPAPHPCASANPRTSPSSTPRRTPPPSPAPHHAPPPLPGAHPTPPPLSPALRASAALPTPYFALHPERSRPPSQQPLQQLFLQPQTRTHTQPHKEREREEEGQQQEQMWIPHHPYAASALSLAPSFYAGGRATPLGEMRFPLPPPPSMGGGGGLSMLSGVLSSGGPSSRPSPRAGPSTGVEAPPAMGGYEVPEPRTNKEKGKGRLARLWTRLLSTPSAPATPKPRPKTREKEREGDEWRRTSFMDLAPAPSPLAQLAGSLRRSVRKTRSAARLHVPAPSPRASCSPRVSGSLSPPMSPTNTSRASRSPRVSGSLSPPMSPTSAARTSTSCVSFAFSDAREPGTPLTPVSFDVPLPPLPAPSPLPISPAPALPPAPVAKDYAFPAPAPIPTLTRARSDSALAAEAEEDWTLALDLALSTGMLLRGVLPLPALPAPFCGSGARPESRDSKMTVCGRRGRVDSLFSVGGAVGGALDPWRR
ncbi:hypothetical protein HWV62_33647 [Athelia sp. TMB]|nr:hypothetical protein HWV62_33647 [Athelia sp. TMB]